ncbi:MAG: helix-hairpin-helix domain-containing protein, partial [Methanoregula sp.]|nr:helix-hairpin-helix domain-containing protein [Methanoregula sp.]
VIKESQKMLHLAFDQLEANEQVIGEDIRGRTAEEMNLGKCPACGGTIAIKHMRGNAQFIGCSRYPECSFNIGLPNAQWGFAVRTDDICDKHNLNFVRLIRKGARPWDIGCPLCHQVSSNKDSLSEIPSMDEKLAKKILSQHIYTVAELARSLPEPLAKRLDLPLEAAQKLISDAGAVLEKLRRRSECKKFLRERIVPRKGRSSAKILTALKELGITEMSGLVHTDAATLKKAGVSDAETEQILTDAKTTYYGQVLKEIGIPAVSLKKYLAAGIIRPEQFCERTPEALSKLAGVSPATVQRHVGLVCTALNKPVTKKVPKAKSEKSKKELLAIKGITDTLIEKLARAGITSAATLLSSDAEKTAASSGITLQKIKDLQAAIKKKKDTAIIQI